MVAPTPNPFWVEVKAQATAGLVVAGAIGVMGGIGYLIHTVPRQLDQVLSNQSEFKDRVGSLERNVNSLERNDRAQDTRLVRLESRP